MHSYRRGNKDAKDMTEQEAAAYADEHNIGAEATADAQLVGEANAGAISALHEDEDAEGEPEKEPTPPPRTPKSKSGRKLKPAKTTPATAPSESAVAPSSSSIVPPPKPATQEKEKSPDKKRKRASKKGADEPVSTIESEELAVETPKSAPKPRKKKTKTDA